MRSSIGEVITIVLCVLLGAAGQILLKLGASNPALAGSLGSGDWPGFVMRALMTPKVVLGLALYAGSTILWLVVLARTELSYAYPFISLGFLITTLFGWLALGEAVSAYRLAGVALIISGVILVARS